MDTKSNVINAEKIADKYVRMCCQMLAEGGIHTRGYKKCATLLEDIVEDELSAYFEGVNTTLKSVEECDIMEYIGELYENFIEPMFMDHCIPKNTLVLPSVCIGTVKKVRRAKTTKRVSFDSS